LSLYTLLFSPIILLTFLSLLFICANCFDSCQGMSKIIQKIGKNTFPLATADPFLFAVYHTDAYPAGTEEMTPIDGRVGDGSDFGPTSGSSGNAADPPYRFYHGRTKPGFPSHPHYGIETLTAVVKGTIDHADSMGNGARYGETSKKVHDEAGSDLQWMTAGSGISHSESFPLISTDPAVGNPTKFFQIWLNLPAASKNVKPHFSMVWGEKVVAKPLAKGGCVTLWNGNAFGLSAPTAPADSYAADPNSKVVVAFLVLKPGDSVTLEGVDDETVNRRIYQIGTSPVTVGADVVAPGHYASLTPTAPATFSLPADATAPAEFLLLQGRPIGEPVFHRGPFVTNTAAEMQQVFVRYQTDHFGQSWPWPESNVVFPREAVRHTNVKGVITNAV